MSKQTALQQFIDKITSNHDSLFEVFYKPEIEEALQMEREQIEDAHEIGYINGGNSKKVNGEQYYNETYGGKDERNN